jgi:hypothetical protein
MEVNSRKKILKRIKTLTIPYVFWSLSVFTIIYTAQMLPYFNDFFSGALLKDYPLKNILYTIFIHPIPYQLWFIRDLFFLVLLTPITYHFFRKGGIIVVLCIGIIWLSGYVPLWYASRLTSFFFFSAGNYIALSKANKFKNLPSVNSRWLIVLWLGILVISTYLLTYRELGIPQLNNTSVLFGLAAFWFNYDLFGSLFEQKKLFKVTQFTFFIYAAHEPMLVTFRKLWLKLFTASETSALVGYFTCPLLTIFICIVIASVLKRNWRGLYNIMTGWR